MSRFTKRHGKHAIQIGAVTKRDNPAFEKLAHYEDLEEKGFKMVNIDKVVEQLEEECKSNKLDECYVDGLNKAIEIVKGGTNV